MRLIKISDIEEVVKYELPTITWKEVMTSIH